MTDAADPRARRLYYGWVMVVVLGLAAAATSPGQSYLIGLFNVPLQEAAGVSETTLSLAYMIGTFGSASLLTFVGTWSDRVGPRRLGILATLGLAVACTYFATGIAGGVVTLTIGFFLLRFTGQGCLSLASTHALALWWERRLGRVEAIRLAIFTGISVILPNLTSMSILHLGYRWTYAIFAGVLLLTVLPIVVVLWKNHPKDVGQAFEDAPLRAEDDTTEPNDGLTLPQAVRSYAYWVQAGLIALFAGAATALVFHAQPILLSHGFGEDRAIFWAAWCVTTWAATGFVFHFVGGWLVDRLPVRIMLCLTASLMAVASTLAGFATTVPVAIAAWAVLGTVHGIVGPTLSAVTVRHFGRKSLGAIKGTFATIGVGASGLGPFLVAGIAQLKDADSPDFALSLWLINAVAVPLAVASLLVRNPARAGLRRSNRDAESARAGQRPTRP